LQDYGAERRLTLAQYDRLGRVNGAVNAAVSDVLEQGIRLGALPRDKAALDAVLREAFIPHLARVNNAGQFVRRVAVRTELLARSLAAVDLFVEARLLLRDRRPSGDVEIEIVEVAHEALLREWPALRGWLEADREFLIGKEKLAEDIASWRNANPWQKDDALLSRLNLTRARQWLIERQSQDFNSEEREFIAASIARAENITRRRRRAGLAAACILLLITGAAIWESIQAKNGRREAARAQSIAESRLGLARRSAEDLVKLVATDLRSIQGIRTETLERLLQTAQSSFDELSSAIGDDPTFAQYRAQMMSEFGETYLKLKDKGVYKANSAYEESLLIYRNLAAKDPNAIVWQRGIADQIEHIGLARQLLGQIEQAMESFQSTLDIRRSLAKREPNNAISHRDLASSYYDIGEIQMIRRMASDSLASHNQALDEQQRALAIDPDNLDLQYKLSLIQVSIGVAYEALGQREKQLESYLSALAIRKRLVEISPDNADWQRVLSYAYFWIGGYYLGEGNVGKALKNFQECLEARLSLAKSNPGDLVAKYDLAWAYQMLGIALLKKGDLAGADANLHDALRQREYLVEFDPKNTKWRKDLALSHDSLGDLATVQNVPLVALDEYNLAVKTMENLISGAPASAGWRDSLAVTYNKVAAVQRCRGEMDGALVGYEQSLSIRNKLLMENPNDFATVLRVARSEELVGEVLELRAKPELARTHYNRVIELALRMLEMHRDDAAVRSLLTAAQRRLYIIGIGDGSDDGLNACPAAQAG
jgi:tetratricopeptide (TPR) repeat protein